MTLNDAKHIIRNDSAGFTKWVLAAGVLTSAQESTLDDLLACLKRSGLPAEMAATTLYVRTRRPRQDNTIASIILDYDDWALYLKR
jgi:hypothetical protein